MYAVVSMGGKQTRVVVGGKYRVEKIAEDINGTIKNEDVLLVHDGKQATVGMPFVKSACVEATIIDQIRGPKIRIIKMRRRKHSMTKTGHRQPYTWIKVTSITVGDKVLDKLEGKVAVEVKQAAKVRPAISMNTVESKPAEEVVVDETKDKS